MRSSRQISEYYSGDGSAVGGIPGTASNIPDAAASYQTEISGTTGSGYQRSDVTTNYEVSRSVSHIVPATGQVERLSVSVMVDNITDTVTMGAIEQATIAAAGIDFVRGDVITVSSIAFDRTFEIEQETAMAETQQQEFYLKIAQWAAVAVALIALFFVVRSLRRSLTTSPEMAVLVEKPDDVRAALLERVREVKDVDQQKLIEEKLAELGKVDDWEEALDSLGLDAIGPPKFDDKQKAAAEKAQMLRQVQLMAKKRPRLWRRLFNSGWVRTKAKHEQCKAC